MNRTYLLLITFFTFSLFSANAQQSDLKILYGEQTYNQYLEKDWSGLITTANEALDKGVDFYYLRIRLGIAYANQKNYRKAIINYKKAIDFVPNDPIAQEYLYYAYLYSGQKNVARLYAANLPVSLRKKIKPENLSVLGGIYMETGFAFADYDDKDISLPSTSEIYLSEIFTRKSQSYFNMNLLLNVAKPVSVNLAYTSLGIQSEHQYKVKDKDLEQEDLTVKQIDFALSVNIYNASGLMITPFFHNVNTSLTLTEIMYDTTAYELEQGIDIDFGRSINSLKWNDQLLGFGVVKRSGLFDLAASLSYSWLNETSQQQLNAKLSYLPKGNYSLYFTPELRFFNEDQSSRMIYKLAVGGQLTTRLWGETAFTYGDLKNTHENFGAIVYNLPDKTIYKADAVLNLAFTNGVSLSLRYQLTRKESPLTSHTLGTAQDEGFGFGGGTSDMGTDWIETETFFPFNQHFIILGFNWAI